MSPLQVGDEAPAVPGVAPGDGPRALFFYKVTCPTCQLAAPTMGTFEREFPGRVVGIGQDPEGLLASFTDEHDMGIRSVVDAPPYTVSDAYMVESVPTLFLIGDDGRVVESVGAWDRDGFNRIAAKLADLMGIDPVIVSTPDDGRPPFQPG
jgi:hypothetical protein